jgi:hypothetical protein
MSDIAEINKLIEITNKNDNIIRMLFDEMQDNENIYSLLKKYAPGYKPLDPIRILKTCENEPENNNCL